jgi:hypothetical protein
MIKKKKDGKNQLEVKDTCNRMWKKRIVKKTEADKKR